MEHCIRYGVPDAPWKKVTCPQRWVVGLRKFLPLAVPWPAIPAFAELVFLVLS